MRAPEPEVEEKDTEEEAAEEEEMGIDEFAQYCCKYASEIDCSITGKSMLALYERIDRRVDIMMEQGLVDEVKRLKEMGCTRDMVAMQGLGYKEILDYLDGTISLGEAVYIIKRDTRHFAKRQLTWFKRERDEKDIFKLMVHFIFLMGLVLALVTLVSKMI